MCSDDYRTDILIVSRLLNDAGEPFQLRIVELVETGVVEINEVNALLYPVEVGLHAMVAGIVTQALVFKDGRVKPVRKLNDEFATGVMEVQFMIADARIERHAAESCELVVDGVLPGGVEVVGRGDFLFAIGTKLHVLIDIAHPAKIAEMPVELRVLLRGVGSDERHHDITAVAGVSGDGELELGRGRESQEKNQCECAHYE